MPIDPTIPLQVRLPEIDNPQNVLLRVLQLQNAQRENEMGQAKMDEYRRGVDDKNRLYQIASQDYAKPEDRESALLRGGFFDQAGKLTKVRTDSAESAAKVEKDQLDAAHKRVDILGQASGWLRQNPTPENALAVTQHLLENQVLTPEQAQASVAKINANPTPAVIAQNAEMAFRTAMQAKEQLPKFETRNLGGSTDTLALDPVTGQARTVNSAQNTQSPDNAATNARTAADNAANRSIEQQRLTEQSKHNRNMEGFRGAEVQNQAGARSQQGVIELRKEFNTLQEVKNFKEVLPIIESVQRAPNTPAGDIDLIYGVGKIMDPNSVVREGEMKLAIAAGSPAQRLQGYINYVQGGGRLGPSQRQELMAIMNSRVQGLKSNYDNARKTYETAADRQGLPRDQIFIENTVPAAPPVSLDALSSGPKGGRGSAYQPPKVVNFGDLK